MEEDIHRLSSKISGRRFDTRMIIQSSSLLQKVMSSTPRIAGYKTNQALPFLSMCAVPLPTIISPKTLKFSVPLELCFTQGNRYSKYHHCRFFKILRQTNPRHELMTRRLKRSTCKGCLRTILTSIITTVVPTKQICSGQVYLTTPIEQQIKLEEG
jgi:hypothetical protein